MSKFMDRLRSKRTDSVKMETPAASPKTKPSKSLHNKKKDVKLALNDIQFKTFLSLFMSNKETISSITATNEEYKPKLVEYTRAKGAEDEKGNRVFRYGNIIAAVRISRHKILLIEKVEKLVYTLKKKKVITPKEAKKIVSAQYSLTLNETAYQALQAELDNWGAVVQRNVSVDEEELKRLIAEGRLTVDKYNDLFEIEEKTSFVPTRVKE